MSLTVVGVGPGDPELLTLKAARVIAEAAVVAYPTTSRGAMAAAIADAHLGTGRDAAHTTLAFAVPMTGDGAAEAAYDEAAAALAAHLDAGRKVALLCEGDPMLYGSAASVMARLAGRHPIAVVPGVTAASACAAAAGVSLARGQTPLTVLPATADTAMLDTALAGAGAVVIYKVGRHFDAIAARLRACGRTGTLVARAGLPEQSIVRLEEAPGGAKPYFSTILSPERAAPAASTASTALTTRTAPAVPAECVALVVLGPSALPTARRAAAALAASGRTAEIHGLLGRLDAPDVDVPFTAAADHLAGLFRAGRPIIGLFSTGILFRAIGPLLADKPTEPPVLALAQDASTVVPLLGAHRGGTALAQTLAGAFGVPAATTTQGELRLGLALDDPPPGWHVADPAPFKRLAADCAAGGGAAPDPSLDFLAGLPRGHTRVRATVRRTADAHRIPTYVARRVALGMGAERFADTADAVAFARDALAAADLDPRAVAIVATLDRKADEAAINAVAADLGAPLRVFDATRLAAEESRLVHPSEAVRAAVGVAGVAEAAALAAAGPDGVLVTPKTVRGPLTLALALAPTPILSAGRARGELLVVGIGPGAPAWRTGECRSLLARADAFVGYTLYLDLVEDLRTVQSRHDFALGDEAARVRFALEFAGEGRTVALISSGDAGIYAMASLAMELLDAGDLRDAARRVALTVAPGISAAQAAAARVGAPLGHDFAFISLSDLLTPWPVIERRLRAAAEGDFAVALYNPRSRRRADHLARALALLGARRGADTPVVVASSLGRPQETLVHTTLGRLDPAGVDMLATVLVGASTTRRFRRGDGREIVYTPRGYEVST